MLLVMLITATGSKLGQRVTLHIQTTRQTGFPYPFIVVLWQPGTLPLGFQSSSTITILHSRPSCFSEEKWTQKKWSIPYDQVKKKGRRDQWLFFTTSLRPLTSSTGPGDLHRCTVFPEPPEPPRSLFPLGNSLSMLSQCSGEALYDTSFGRSPRVGINPSEVKNIIGHLETHSSLNIADVSW